jgi:exodeoxyribonuclease V alpha subunit
MRGGVKVYRGSSAAARCYVEADRSRVDDYYLAEGTGIAERLAIDADGHVVALPTMDGETYESWVAGVDPETSQRRGRLRTDGHAVRFVEFVVNGPKSWSLAAELHPEIAVAYEAAQARAAEQILSWLGQHAVTRVGPRGAQVAVPVQRIEAAVIRHYTSRAGDPHRHLHVQVNARVFAAGRWRGLDTVAVRDSIAAINGIGHAAVMCDPGFRAALAARGYSLTGDGDIEPLMEFVGPFSKRAAQISANIERFESEWRAAHPGQEPGPAIRRSFDARAWAVGRLDKVIPVDAAAVRSRWLDELHALGYRNPRGPIQLALPLAGQLDRDAVAADVLTRLGAQRSAWNHADVRGQAELLIAAASTVADPAVRAELAEDITNRALALSIPLLDRAGVPSHIRALTSHQVIAVEHDLDGRFAVRGAQRAAPARLTLEPDLDAGHCEVVRAVSGTAPLVVIEGAAGTGKTRTLAAARLHLARQGHRLIVVTPTLKAAHVARVETGADAGSAAWLAHQHGWRWNEQGTWTRLGPGDVDPAIGRVYLGPDHRALLHAGDLLLVDEAGMLDQDTARALLTVADETGARLVLVGDRHQLPAVGRGGVLDLAHRWVDPAAHLLLDAVHRFVDAEYARLSLAMRTGETPGEVFDALAERGLVRVHATAHDARTAIAAAAVTDSTTAVMAGTREEVAALNDAIRALRIRSGQVDDGSGTTTTAGERLALGDVLATRRNDAGLDVANRDTWTVTHVGRDGSISLHGERGGRDLPVPYVREHVELAYATTVHGAQGSTTQAAHLLLGEHTTAAQAYVGMTRGRVSNTVHVIATDLDEAREQWVAVFARDRADLGPGQARETAARDAARYATRPARHVPPSEDLTLVLTRLAAAWTEQRRAHFALDHLCRDLEQAQADQAAYERRHDGAGPARAHMVSSRSAANQAKQDAEPASELLREATNRVRAGLYREWEHDRPLASTAVLRIESGPGRLHLHRGEVHAAQEQLDRWVAKWSDIIDLHHRPGRVRDVALRGLRPEDLDAALARHARLVAESHHPAETAILRRADRLDAAANRAADRYVELSRQADREVGNLRGYTPNERLPELLDKTRAAERRIVTADERVARLSDDPAITTSPDPAGVLRAARADWTSQRQEAIAAAAQRAHTAVADGISRRHHHDYTAAAHVDHGPSIGR